MPTTPKLALPYPAPTDPADVPADMNALATRLDAVTGAASGLASLDSGGKVPAAQIPAGVVTAIGEIDLTASVNFTGIPATFDHLRLVIRARSTAAGVFSNVFMRCNNVATGSYFVTILQATGAGTSIVNEAAQPQANLGMVQAASGAAGHQGTIVLDIPDANTSGYQKVGVGKGFCLNTGNPQDIVQFSIGASLGVAVPITQISLLLTGNVPFAAGSRAWLYGILGA